MRRPESHFGSYAWAGLLAYVAVVDWLGPESLTHAAERARGTYIGRLLVPAAAVYTTAHVVGALPRQADLFYKIIELKGERPVDFEA